MASALTSELRNSDHAAAAYCRTHQALCAGFAANLPIVPTFYSTPDGGVRAHLGEWTWLSLLVSLV
jgi:hypothetical protein